MDDAKSSCTDAIKKIASTLGVGLAQLYSDNHHAGSTRNATFQRNATRNTRPQTGQNRTRRSGGNGGDPDRLSQRQLSSIWSLGRRLGLGADEIRQRSVQEYGVVPEFLSRQNASSFISNLGEQVGRGTQ